MSELSAAPMHDEPSYQPPTFEVICLDCEISAYAPDGDDTPLF